MKTNLTTKIYTKNGILPESIFSGEKVLDVGCGQRKLPGSIGMDIVKNSQADIIYDASVTPWPFEDNSFDLIFTNHFLEHVYDLFGFLEETHRVLKPGGRFIAQVPYFRCTDAYGDPTHRQFFTSQSLEYVIKGTKLSEYNYSSAKFKKIGFWYGWPAKSRNPLARMFKAFIGRHPKFYDQYLSLLLPVPCLTWELEVIK